MVPWTPQQYVDMERARWAPHASSTFTPALTGEELGMIVETLVLANDADGTRALGAPPNSEQAIAWRAFIARRALLCQKLQALVPAPSGSHGPVQSRMPAWATVAFETLSAFERRGAEMQLDPADWRTQAVTAWRSQPGRMGSAPVYCRADGSRLLCKFHDLSASEVAVLVLVSDGPAPRFEAFARMARADYEQLVEVR